MQTFQDVWKLVDDFCATKVCDVAYNMWFKPITPVDFKNGEAVLRVPHSIHKKVIEQTYSELIRVSFQNIMGFPVGLRILCDETPDGVVANEAVELAKKYCGDDEPGFINGILGAIIKSKS